MEERTHFAPAERTSDDVIKAENELISSLAKFTELFGAINGIGAVLNKNRQVVYANEDFIRSFGFQNIENLLGKRPGEAISCIHSREFHWRMWNIRSMQCLWCGECHFREPVYRCPLNTGNTHHFV